MEPYKSYSDDGEVKVRPVDTVSPGMDIAIFALAIFNVVWLVNVPSIEEALSSASRVTPFWITWKPLAIVPGILAGSFMLVFLLRLKHGFLPVALRWLILGAVLVTPYFMISSLNTVQKAKEIQNVKLKEYLDKLEQKELGIQLVEDSHKKQIQEKDRQIAANAAQMAALREENGKLNGQKADDAKKINENNKKIADLEKNNQNLANEKKSTEDAMNTMKNELVNTKQDFAKKMEDQNQKIADAFNSGKAAGKSNEDAMSDAENIKIDKPNPPSPKDSGDKVADAFSFLIKTGAIVLLSQFLGPLAMGILPGIFEQIETQDMPALSQTIEKVLDGGKLDIAKLKDEIDKIPNMPLHDHQKFCKGLKSLISAFKSEKKLDTSKAEALIKSLSDMESQLKQTTDEMESDLKEVFKSVKHDKNALESMAETLNQTICKGKGKSPDMLRACIFRYAKTQSFSEQELGMLEKALESVFGER